MINNPNILRMGTLKASRSAVTDDLESQRRGMENAKKWQDDESAKIFSDRSGPAPSESILSSTYGWPQTSMTVTTPEDVYARARAEAEVPDEDVPDVHELGIFDMGAKDAAPTMMSFYAGKSFIEGRKAHNAYLISKGLSPIAEGSR